MKPSVKNTKVVVVGYYGMRNYGDDLFKEAIAQNCSLLFPNAEVRISNPDALPRQSARGGAVLKFIALRMASARRLINALSEMLWADIIVLGGGSVLEDLRGVRAVQFRLSRVFRTRFSGLGVSVGPFRTVDAQKRVVQFLNTFESLVVRDKASLALVQNLGVKARFVAFGGDLAGIFEPQEAGRKRVERTIGVALCNFRGGTWADTQRLLDSLVAAADSSGGAAQDTRYMFLCLSSHPISGDLALSRKAAEYLESEGRKAEVYEYCVGPMGVTETWNTLAGLDFLVAVRLHAAISAYLTAVPFVLFEYHQKCSEFATDVGLATVQRLSLARSDASVSAAILTLLKDKPVPALTPESYREQARSAYMGTSRAVR